MEKVSRRYRNLIMKDTDTKPSWKVRRSLVVLTLLFCAVVISKIVYSEWDSTTAQVALFGAFGLAFATIGSYVFGAIWDDSNFMKRLK